MNNEEIKNTVRTEVRKSLNIDCADPLPLEESFRGNFERVVGLFSGMALAFGGFLATTGWIASSFGLPGSQLVLVAYYLGSVTVGMTLGTYVMDKFFKGANTTEVQQVRDLVWKLDALIKERDQVIKIYEKNQSEQLRKEFDRLTKRMISSGKKLKKMVKKNAYALVNNATVNPDQYASVEKHIDGIAAYAEIASQGLATNLKDIAGYILKPR